MKKMISLCLIGLSFFTGCGDSPLFHHKKAKAPNPPPPSREAQNKANKFELEKLSLHLEVHWLRGPHVAQNKMNSVLFLFFDPQNQLKDLPEGYSMEIHPTMPFGSLNQATSPGEFRHIGRGMYLNDRLLLPMAGQWKLPIQIKNATETIQTVNLNLSLYDFELQHLSLRLVARWLKGPYGSFRTPNALTLMFYDQDNNLVDLPQGYQLEHDPTMPDMMGHGSPRPGRFLRIGQGTYLNDQLHLTMGGLWNINITVNQGGHIIDQVSFDVDVEDID